MEAFLSRCLDSFIIEDVNMNLLEIIIVNDGSKDNSLSIAIEYQKKYPNTFIIVDKENGNYGSCINAALKIATGKYFRICDADDQYNNKILADYIKFLQKATADIILSPYYVFDFKSNISNRMYVPDNLSGKTFAIDELNWREKELSCFRAMHCLCIKTVILKINNYKQLEGISYTDTQFVFYSVMYSSTCSFFQEPIYFYYLGRDGQTMSLASMKKNAFHFFYNADNMLNAYINLPKETLKNKRILLLESILVEFSYFSNISLRHLKNTANNQLLIKEFVKKSKTSIIPCDIESYMVKFNYFKYWYKYHMPQPLLRVLINILEKIKR